jgi:hypothetical protein
MLLLQGTLRQRRVPWSLARNHYNFFNQAKFVLLLLDRLRCRVLISAPS